MHELPILVDFAVAIGAALIGGLLARRLRLPTIVGYLLAGVVIGPFTPGYIGDLHTIQQFAELGVIFLLFGVGLHFSLNDLWAVRSIAIPGALLQMALTTLAGLLLTTFWGWSLTAGLIMGLAISIASTVVLIRNLIDQRLLHAPSGKVALGWLVLEDIATVLILVLLPAFAGHNGANIWQTGLIALAKTAIFAALMLLVGTKFLPWLLKRLALLQSRELFTVAIVGITIGIALGAASLFGVSLALGAFLAGVVINESTLSHQVEAEILPFRETFAVLFFISIGMLVNPIYLFQQWAAELSLALLIIVGKFVLTLVLGALFSRSARTTLVIAIGLCQIGEFSFILGQTGVYLKLLTRDQYALLLAGALISITLNPFLFRLLPWMEKHLQRIPFLWSLLERETAPTSDSQPQALGDHIVLIGCGRIGRQLVSVFQSLSIPYVVVDFNLALVTQLKEEGVQALYGDATSVAVLTHARVSRARTVIVTVPDETKSSVITATVRRLTSDVRLVVRATTSASIHHLKELGATRVIYPELEGCVTIVEVMLERLGYPLNEIQECIEALRNQGEEEQPALLQITPRSSQN
ncbi:cation:proton antiporter [Ktedonospora formicarum]|uniref:Sodium/hydrogen exchanger n=1 Tax=Ktedonospora formicarum TaxID=2778364 RepID=A0A8J3MV65_9CHLR|nr:cation:proton antiporter [Ktedonospora formicarum]GHO46175.1 sodium/hydrogen exchanger [Ktedonospora formicarum]